MGSIFRKSVLSILLLLVFAGLVFALTTVNVNSPTTNQNVSDTILLNATTDLGAMNVTFNWYATSNNSLVLSTTIFNNTPADTLFENATFDTNILPDGNYNLTVNAVNISGSSVSNTSIVSVTVDNTAPVVTLVNSSFNTSDSTPSITFNYTDSLFATASCILYLNSTAYDSTTANNATNTIMTVNATLTGSSYLASVNCTDGSNNVGASSSITINLDTGGPAVTTFNSPSSASYNNVDFVLNVTVTGAASTVTYRLENGSNSSQVIVGYTNMSNSAGNYWNATIDVSSITDWNYTVRINATDAFGNSNSSETLLINIDDTNPTVSSFTCNNINRGASQSCSCSGADNSESFSGSVGTSINTASTSTSGTKTVTCTATDSAGNTATGSASYTVASNGGSGGSGSSGGISAGVQGQYEKKIWTSINAGETATVEVENGAIGVTKVDFIADETMWGAWLKVNKKESLPSMVESFSNKVYKYVEITRSTSVKDDSISDITIDFKVTKDWLSENNLQKENIVLSRYVDGEWVQLSTTVGTDDEMYVHYSASTPGFSYFVIGEEISSVIVVNDDEPLEVVEEVVLEDTEEEVSLPEEEDASKKDTKWVILPIVIILAGILLAFAVFLRKREFFF